MPLKWPRRSSDRLAPFSRPQHPKPLSPCGLLWRRREKHWKCGDSLPSRRCRQRDHLGLHLAVTKLTCSIRTRSILVVDIDHATGRTLVLAGCDDHGVVHLNLELGHLGALLENFRSQRHDLHVVLGTELPSHRTEDARTDRLAFVVNEHCRVGIETNVRTIRAAKFLAV